MADDKGRTRHIMQDGRLLCSGELIEFSPGADIGFPVTCSNCIRKVDSQVASASTVNHPSHYAGKVECIDAIAAATDGLTGEMAFCIGNVLKYCWRSHKKNGIEDLKKAMWYLERAIQVKEAK